MADIVNLNQFRKKQQRVDKDKKGAQNRAKFGWKKAEREIVQKQEADRNKVLDGKKAENLEDC